MTSQEERIRHAWEETHNWITEFTGTATQTYLAKVKIGDLPEAINLLSRVVERLRVLPVWREGMDVPNDSLSPDRLVSYLERGDVLSLSVNYSLPTRTVPIDIHLGIEPDQSRRVDITVAWWADQVFPEGEENYSRFENVLQHFLLLAELFGAERMYIGPESEDRPGEPGAYWVEV